ncbi:MAG: hypothetical protein ACN4E2_06920 [Nitrospinota bacterium]
MKSTIALMIVVMMTISCVTSSDYKNDAYREFNQLYKSEDYNFQAVGKFILESEGGNAYGDIFLAYLDDKFRLELYLDGQLIGAFSGLNQKLYFLDGQTGVKKVYMLRDYISIKVGGNKIVLPVKLLKSIVTGVPPKLRSVSKIYREKHNFCINDKLDNLIICFKDRLKIMEAAGKDWRLIVKPSTVVRRQELAHLKSVSMSYQPANIELKISWDTVIKKSATDFSAGYFSFDDEVDFIS